VLLPYDPLTVIAYECGTLAAAATAGLAGAIFPPPQDVNATTDMASENKIRSFRNFLRVKKLPENANPATPKVGKKNAYNIPVLPGCIKTADEDWVRIVRVEVAMLLPAGRDAGENEHVTPTGRFAQESESASCKDPLTVT
jgi:hypothetical protein